MLFEKKLKKKEKEDNLVLINQYNISVISKVKQDLIGNKFNQ